LLENYRVGSYNAKSISQYCLYSSLDTVNDLLIFGKDFLKIEVRSQTVRCAYCQNALLSDWKLYLNVGVTFKNPIHK